MKIEDWICWLKENKKVDLQGFSFPNEMEFSAALLMIADNSRHLQSLAHDIMLHSKEANGELRNADGLSSDGGWVALDFGTYALHVMLEETHLRFALPELWGKLGGETLNC